MDDGKTMVRNDRKTTIRFHKKNGEQIGLPKQLLYKDGRSESFAAALQRLAKLLGLEDGEVDDKFLEKLDEKLTQIEKAEAEAIANGKVVKGQPYPVDDAVKVNEWYLGIWRNNLRPNSGDLFNEIKLNVRSCFEREPTVLPVVLAKQKVEGFNGRRMAHSWNTDFNEGFFNTAEGVILLRLLSEAGFKISKVDERYLTVFGHVAKYPATTLQAQCGELSKSDPLFSEISAGGKGFEFYEVKNEETGSIGYNYKKPKVPGKKSAQEYYQEAINKATPEEIIVLGDTIYRLLSEFVEQFEASNKQVSNLLEEGGYLEFTQGIAAINVSRYYCQLMTIFEELAKKDSSLGEKRDELLAKPLAKKLYDRCEEGDFPEGKANEVIRQSRDGGGFIQLYFGDRLNKEAPIQSMHGMPSGVAVQQPVPPAPAPSLESANVVTPAPF